MIMLSDYSSLCAQNVCRSVRNMTIQLKLKLKLLKITHNNAYVIAVFRIKFNCEFRLR